MSKPSHAEIESFRLLLAREAGLRFDEDKNALLAEVLTSRVRKTGCSTSCAYLNGELSRGELDELARALTVSETYFFRNQDQFRALETILEAHKASSSRHFRVLSAGCSSGEEAYSIAITVRRTIPDVDSWNISILGVDLNPDAVKKARAATYTSWSLRETPDFIRDRFLRRNGTHYTLHDSVREMARFEHANLVRESSHEWGRETFDVIFCRNVLMYFAPEAARRVVAMLARSLAPRGHLFLGHAENLRGLSHAFHLKHSHGTFYYSRRDTLHRGEEPPVPSLEQASRARVTPALIADDTSWYQAINQASQRIEAISREAQYRAGTAAGYASSAESSSPGHPSPTKRRDLSFAMDLMKQEKFHEALRALAGDPLLPSEPDELVLRAMLLVSTGALPQAQALCEQILALDELNAGAHYIMAICNEHLGDVEGAIDHSQTAVYLDSAFAMPHLQLGRLAHRRDELATARRELDLAAALLAREDVARIVLFGGGFSRQALVELCRAELRACGGET